MADLQLRSSAFNDHDLMPERLSRLGGNVSPPLAWSAAPDNVAELVLMVEDPDAGEPPSLHWLVTGIDPHVTESAEGRTPVGGDEQVNSFGDRGWFGPRPPKGDNPHRYFFRLYAVDEPLKLPQRPSTTDVHHAVKGHEVASGTLIGTFGR